MKWAFGKQPQYEKWLDEALRLLSPLHILQRRILSVLRIALGKYFFYAYTSSMIALFLFHFLSASPFVSASSLKFPDHFQWCVATAGHQVEGDNIHSDWWNWEKLPGKIRNGDTSGKASHHWDRVDEDADWMKQLGANMYRFSIEWSRLEPEPGKWDSEAAAHYKSELASLRRRGLTPFVTIHHFVQPQWFTASGGWRRPDSPEIFLNYVEKLEATFGKEINYWVTFNEPSVVLMGGYGLGLMPPGEKNWDLWDPSINILKAHAKAYTLLHAKARERQQNIRVGFAFHIRPLVAGQGWIAPVVKYADFLTNWSLPLAIKTGELQGLRKIHFLGLSIPWPDKIKIAGLANTQDFLGVNYYTREYIRVGFFPMTLRRDPLPGLVGTELLNWGIDPEGFYFTLKSAHEFFPSLPFMITENGLNDPSDQFRANYIREHLIQMHKAMTDLRIQILGYCHWTLMDNFEWIEGFTPRFGLLEVDYKTGARKARASAQVFEHAARTNSIDDSASAKPPPSGAN